MHSPTGTVSSRGIFALPLISHSSDHRKMGPVIRLDVDGEAFEVATRPGHPGQYDYTWIMGRDPGYGFTSARSDGEPPTTAEHVEAIRGFLAQIDPETGHIE